MIKVIVSSKYLYSELKKIDFEKHRIESAQVFNKQLRLTSFYQILKINLADSFQMPAREIRQDNRRWDWIRDTLKKVPDQPVTLEITEGIVNLIFQY